MACPIGNMKDVLHNANISNHAIGILTKAMNPYRTKRYQNTRELLNAIERHDAPEDDGKDTVITPTDGISIFSILNDNSFIAYYQGKRLRLKTLIEWPTVPAGGGCSVGHRLGDGSALHLSEPERERGHFVRGAAAVPDAVGGLLSRTTCCCLLRPGSTRPASSRRSTS